MSDNVTPLGDIADWIDGLFERHEDNENIVRAQVEADLPGVGRYLWWWNHLNWEVMRFNVGGITDLLRVGNGFREGGWGYGQDVLRVVSIIPIVRGAGGVLRGGAAAIRNVNRVIRLSRTARIVEQTRSGLTLLDQGGAPLCTFTATVNAVNLARGEYYFSTVDDLLNLVLPNVSRVARRAGTYRGGLNNILEALEGVGVNLRRVQIADDHLHTIDNIIRNNPLDSVLFHIQTPAMAVDGTGHTLAATFSRSRGVLFHDPAGGETIRGIQGLLQKYPGAYLLTNRPAAIFNQSIVVLPEVAARSGAGIQVGRGVLGILPLSIAILVRPVFQRLSADQAGLLTHPLTGPPLTRRSYRRRTDLLPIERR